MGTGNGKQLRQLVNEKFSAKVFAEPNSGCWLWTGKVDSRGYGRIRNHYKYIGAHRASYEFHVGPIPVGQCVCHKCDTPACVNPDHLFLGTHADNMRDKCAKGREPCRTGELGPNARLTPANVTEIRSSSESKLALAKRFGVTRQYIGEIIKRKSWAHLPAL